ncbi:MAG: aldehyde oxidase and xanthine dehydrogenase molybdopterin binding protein [Thermomicrobiales bacterium]|jgi:CO/xanthine dehydrogenase Mo-binding subunit|nr:aldehyde oxidase and xanthine dehydrogenase molybdopterin binding protein [Thermomicrobiales bacterium]
MAETRAVGQRVRRIDAPQKLTGQERFTGDLRIPGMLIARPVTSPYAHARVRTIDASAALAIPGVVTVLTSDDLSVARDASGAPVKAPIASGEAVYAGQFVALVLAETDAAAQDGVAAVEVDYEPLPVVVTLDEGLDPASPHIRETRQQANEEEAAMHNADAAIQAEENDEFVGPNVSNSVHFARGDVAAGFAAADEIVELTLESLTVHQGYLEPQVCLVDIEPLGDLTVYTSTQAAFYCRTRVAETVGMPTQRVNVVPMPVGGGFGGKFVLIEPMVAAAALAVGRPVLLRYSRMDDFLAGNPAPDCRITVKLGATRAGDITALESHLVFDTGSSGGSPLQIAAILHGGYYRFPNLELRGHEVLTNKPGAGAYRAPGAQQGTFAIESAVDELARKLDLDPLEFRLRNCAVEGDERPNGGAWPRIGLKESLEALQAHPAWRDRERARANGRGVGIAVGGWPGGIEPATAVCRLDSNGKLTVVLGSVDLTGTNTAFAQIAAETFNMTSDDIAVTTAPTDAAPFAGGTGGSKITYTVGKAVQRAAEDALRQILAVASEALEASVEDLEMVDGAVRVRGVPGSEISLKDIAGRTMGFAARNEPVYGTGSTAIRESAPGFAVHLVEVEVDDITGVTRPVRYVAVQDVGFAINPAEVEAQIHGGVAQGLGWALYEGMVYDGDGQLLTATLMDYVLPRAEMVPPIETVLVEVPSEHGAYGAKGIGEPPAIPGAAAVANAIRDLTGARMTSLPIRPEQVAKAQWDAASAPAAD